MKEPMRCETTNCMDTKEFCGAPWPSKVLKGWEILVPPKCPQRNSP
jgi:hypothetical protein